MTQSTVFIVFILTLLLGLQPLTTDLYLPALPLITETFDAPVSLSQMTLSALLLSFGASQLVWGPLSDYYGRRPILLIGLGLYTLSAIAGSLVNTMAWLVAWRVVQGVAMGAAIMCARALVRDLFDNPVQAAKTMSQGLSGLGVVACLATPVGGLITAWFGWRAVFLFLAIISALSLAVIFWRLEETLRSPRTESLQPAQLMATWRGILSHHTFWSYALLQTATYGGLFVFLASSSFVFIQYLELSTPVYGLIMFSMSGSYIAGTLLCRRLLLAFSVQKTVVIGGFFAIIGGTLMALFAVLGWQSVLAIMGPFYLYMIGHGINQPCAQSGVMGPFPKSAGAASALSSLIMVAGAFVVGQWLGRAMDGSSVPMALGIWFCGLAVAATGWGLAARVRVPAPI
ncbi:MAG: multidrug effflux MFS transporter [Saccharospirillum sp.]